MGKGFIVMVDPNCDHILELLGVIDLPGMTVPLDLRPPPLVIELKPERLVPDINITLPLERKKRDWEQRQRKPRRRS